MERERSVAYKTTIKNVLEGKYISPGGFNPNYVLTKLGQRLSRVHLLATVTNTFVSDDNKYAFVVLDDGIGVIRSKAFQDTKALGKLKKGDLVDFVGKVREYNDERYLIPEVIKKVENPNLEMLRKLEILKFLEDWKKKRKSIFETKKDGLTIEEIKEKLNDINPKEIEGILETEEIEGEINEEKTKDEDNKTARELVLKVISDLDDGKGVEYIKIVEKVNLPENITENAINELLSEGSCYEPRAGKIRVL